MQCLFSPSCYFTQKPSVTKMKANTTTRGASEPKNLLTTCKELLSRRDFTGCREFAHRVPRSDPNFSIQVDQILAVADVLGAAEPGPGSCHPDWPAVLQLRRADAGNRDLARRQFKTLVRLLDPNKNRLPFAEDALMRVREAWLVVSERCRENCSEGGSKPNEDIAKSFWTMCPYCWYLHEYEKKYEGCSFRCGTCQRTFHGVAVKPPSSETVVEGKEQYYCYNVSLPCRYPVGAEGRRFEDDDGVRDYCEKGVGTMWPQGNGNRKMRIKTTARRVKTKAFDPISDSDLEAEGDGVLEFE